MCLKCGKLSGLPSWLSCKESACNVRDLGSIPGLGKSLGEGKGYPLQYSDLEDSMDCIVHGVSESDTSDFHFTSLHIHIYYFINFIMLLKNASFITQTQWLKCFEGSSKWFFLFFVLLNRSLLFFGRAKWCSALWQQLWCRVSAVLCWASVHTAP